MTATGMVEARGRDSAGNESALGLINITNIVVDQDPLRITNAAMNKDGTEITIQFNHVLDRNVQLNKGKFHLAGLNAGIDTATYSSDQVIVLKLSEPEVAGSGLQQIAMDVDYEAVVVQEGKAILEWKGLMVKSLQETNALRLQLQSFFPDNPNGAIQINNVMGYMHVQTPGDVTGDNIFDRNDILFLLLQIDNLAVTNMQNQD